MEKVKFAKKIVVFLHSFLMSILFRYRRYYEHKQYGRYEFAYCEELKDKRVYVLANGPSLKDELKTLLDDESFIKAIKFVLNFFSTSDYYSILKPDMYCLADKGFFIAKTTESHQKTLKSLNDYTTWKMKLFVPNNFFDSAKKIIKNPNITIIPISILLFGGFESKKYEYYKKGYAVPSYVNVTLMIEYVLLNMGCKDIRLYGVDHTFFDGMTVNDDNIPCIMDKHFNKVEMRPLYKLGGGYFSVSGWLMDKYLTFKEHENLRGYADYLGAQIINCTKNSLIDAYVRLAQLEKNKNNRI